MAPRIPRDNQGVTSSPASQGLAARVRSARLSSSPEAEILGTAQRARARRASHDATHEPPRKKPASRSERTPPTRSKPALALSSSPASTTNSAKRARKALDVLDLEQNGDRAQLAQTTPAKSKAGNNARSTPNKSNGANPPASAASPRKRAKTTREEPILISDESSIEDDLDDASVVPAEAEKPVQPTMYRHTRSASAKAAAIMTSPDDTRTLTNLDTKPSRIAMPPPLMPSETASTNGAYQTALSFSQPAVAPRQPSTLPLDETFVGQPPELTPTDEMFTASQIPENTQPSAAPSYSQQTPSAVEIEQPLPATSWAWGMLVAAQRDLSAPNHHCQDVLLPRTRDEFSIGRKLQSHISKRLNPNARVDIQINGVELSARHCRIWRQTVASSLGTSTAGGLYSYTNLTVLDNEPRAALAFRLEDLSKNGTFVNNQLVGHGVKVELHDGDLIRFGSDTAGKIFEYRWITFDPPAVRDENPRGGFTAAYQVANDIGKGTFAIVKRCIHRATGDWRAVKIINKKKHLRDPKTLEMFERELDIVKRLDHDYIVKFYEQFEDQEHIYLILEHIAGGDLLDYVIARDGMEESDVAEVTRMICSGVAYLHQCGIVHRDLKPDNLLLTRDEHPVCKISDFGLARMFEAGVDLTTQCGTANYLAPEVLIYRNGKAGYDQAVDAWSIGVIVYACLSNASPFVEDTKEDIYLRMPRRSPDVSLLRKQGTSELAVEFIQRLLQHDPERRMTVAQALDDPFLQSVRSKHQATGIISTLPEKPSITQRVQSTTSRAASRNGLDSSRALEAQLSQDFARVAVADGMPSSSAPAALPSPRSTRSRKATMTSSQQK